MELKTLRCPQCDAILEVDDGLDTFYCKYCGSKIILDGQSDATIRAKVKIKQMEHDRYKKELKHKKEVTESKHMTIVAVSFILLMVIFIFVMVGQENNLGRSLEKTETKIHELMEEGEFDQALQLAESIYYDGSNGGETKKKWDKKRKALIKEINAAKKTYVEDYGIPVTISDSEAKGMNYKDLVDILKQAGFQNIQTVKLNEKSGFFSKAGAEDVKEVSIDEDTSFKSTDKFLASASIIIKYYGLDE